MLYDSDQTYHIIIRYVFIAYRNITTTSNWCFINTTYHINYNDMIYDTYHIISMYSTTNDVLFNRINESMSAQAEAAEAPARDAVVTADALKTVIDSSWSLACARCCLLLSVVADTCSAEAQPKPRDISLVRIRTPDVGDDGAANAANIVNAHKFEYMWVFWDDWPKYRGRKLVIHKRRSSYTIEYAFSANHHQGNHEAIRYIREAFENHRAVLCLGRTPAKMIRYSGA